MIKSIYTKNVLSYFFIIILSLFSSFLLTSFLFQKQEAQSHEDELITLGKQVINLYQRLDDNSFNAYLKSFSALPLEVYIFNENGIVSQNGTNIKTMQRETINYVLDGGVYRGRMNSHHEGIGLPFTMNNKNYALFIRPAIIEKFSQIREILLTALFTASIVGILLILLTTRFLVQPIVQMTNATRELAKGNFQARMNVKSRDEIGELANSFNFMVEELNKTEQMRKDFVANVSHEFQSPLTAIRGMAVALKDEMVDPKDEKLYLGLIVEESKRLSSLTKQLLNLSSLEVNKHPFYPRLYRLDQQIRNQLVAMQPLWMEKQLEIDFDLSKMEVYADENLMSQVWTNLFSNAIKYNAINGKITVQGQKLEDEIKITVSNTGSGIPEKDIPYIFDRFYKGDKSHKRTSHSYGLGLAVVKRIIDLHDGNISVTSFEGKETTFMIRIPKK
ncbi:HAMP domain-containing histidine kinase [Bacillus sp. FJAT-29790]|uniref:HAMP domain-containing sensor histidine kinase n=1 Tax=Bacillus sp. FJAT-29790 TaxID=1895002 RepID=UPI001C245141|nr:HAMP domain-containing sensor histidine kinase [Bacillus sp. FJAT-29790]MBU8880369.1 HAMP domain-containing histidine kinase [Bacillus sp. FJAT-29790]